MSHKGSLLAALGVVIAVAAAAAVPAFAKNPHSHSNSGTKGNSGNAQTHVTICHGAPPNKGFPASHYVRISPSASGVYHGHLRQHDADIIPPFTYNGQTYSQNWNATGQAIWDNGCVAPTSSSTTTTNGTTDTVTVTTTTTTTTTTTGSGGSGSKSGSGSGSGVASASGSTKSGVKGVTHRARPAKARTGAATFTG